MLTSKDLKDIERLYINDHIVFLCNVALELNMADRFQEYLFDNLDNTMLGVDEQELKDVVCWDPDDIESRIKWLDKHIKLLEDDSK